MIEGPEIPVGWSSAPLGAVVSPIKDNVDPKGFPDLPYIGLEHIEAHTMRLTGQGTASDVKSTKTLFRAGDVLYGKLRPYLNKVAVPDFDGICSTDILVFRDSELIAADYLANYLNQLWVAQRAHHESKGVELPRIDWLSLSNFPIVFPSDKSNQVVVANRISQIRRSTASASKHILAGVSALQHLRRSILTAACSGRLTELWRESGGQSQLSPSEVHGAITTADNHDFWPEEWSLEPVGDVFRIQNGRAFPSKEYSPDGVRLLRPGNLGANGEVTWEEKRTVRLPSRWAIDFPDYILREGELLMNLTAQSLKDEFLGRVCLKADPEPALLNQRIARFMNKRAHDVRPFAFLYFKSKFFRRFIEDLDSGTLIRHMHTKKIDRHLMPVPPADEQLEIVQRVSRLLALADSMTGRIQGAMKQVDGSSQAVLAKAFRGELNPISET